MPAPRAAPRLRTRRPSRHKDCGNFGGRSLNPPAPIMSSTNTVRETYKHGRSIWLDHIDRQLIRPGTARYMIQNAGLTGMTFHPTIFEQSTPRDRRHQEIYKAVQ